MAGGRGGTLGRETGGRKRGGGGGGAGEPGPRRGCSEPGDAPLEPACAQTARV